MSTITLNDKQLRVAAAALFHQIKTLKAEPSGGLRDRRLQDAQELLEVLAPVKVHDCIDEVYAGDDVTLRGLGIND